MSNICDAVGPRPGAVRDAVCSAVWDAVRPVGDAVWDAVRPVGDAVWVAVGNVVVDIMNDLTR